MVERLGIDDDCMVDPGVHWCISRFTRGYGELMTTTTLFLIASVSMGAPSMQETTIESAPLLDGLGSGIPNWWWRSPDIDHLRSTPLRSAAIPADWRVVGGAAEYRIVDEDGVPVLRGTGDADRNAFLVDPRIYGDFLLECDVRIASDGGNSGIQIRSSIDGDRMVGYQIEIDPSPRSWSGGLYDEARRGWLASLADNLDGRAAFVPGKWNRYEVLVVGPRIRTWVNGVPAVDHIDFLEDRGQIGFQVHSGRCDVSWRNISIVDLGLRDPRSVVPDADDPGSLDDVLGAAGLVRTVDGYDIGTGGLDLDVPVTMQDGPSSLTIEAVIERGSMRIELGDAEQGPGYRLTIPAPFGSLEEPGRLVVWRWRDRMRAFVDGVPLEPGPPDLNGSLRIGIHAESGVVGTITRITEDPPTIAEMNVIERRDSASE